jgi:Uma2 family endonuclease
MQKVTHIPRYTYSDYEKWKDDWELIDGYPYSMSPSPSGIHQTTCVELIFQIKSGLNTQPCLNQCFVYTELDWIIDDENVVRPDISIVCGKSVKKFIEKAPVLIIEIISESSAYRDKNIKKELYENQGVKYYLIVNPKTKSIEAFELVNNNYQDCVKSVFNLSESCSVTLDYPKIWQML